jgi:hypothetical protein
MVWRFVFNGKCIHSIEGSFEPFPGFGGLIQRSIMLLVTIVEERVEPIGTGFIIAREGIFLTARHVFEDVWRRRTEVRMDDGSTTINSEFYALYVTDEPNPGEPGTFIGGLWPILSVSINPRHDIAAGVLRPMTANGDAVYLPMCLLSLTPPEPGEHASGRTEWRVARSRLPMGNAKSPVLRGRRKAPER